MIDRIRYQEALDYLYSFVDYSLERSDRYGPDAFELDRVRRLLDRLGNPHLAYPSVHIAGTKGKGSVAALIAASLRQAGYRTGLYTSPHLVAFNERIQVDGVSISDADLVELIDRLKPAAAAEPEITTYELMTALGFMYLADQQVDFGVIEVGLGGRLDATNVLSPEVAIITSISLDHTHILGDTIAEIAAEKGGIIKPNIPVVIAPQRESAANTLRALASGRKAPLVDIGRDWEVKALEHSLAAQSFRLRPRDGRSDWVELTTPLLGAHQVDNAATAYVALQVLKRKAARLTEEAIHDGFRSVEWPGRFQVLRRSPTVVVDAAHNQDSARRLGRTIAEYFEGKHVWLVFGASEDKDIRGMLEALIPVADHVTLTKAFHPRAADPADMASIAEALGANITINTPVIEGVRDAIAAAKPDDVVLVTGSLFVVGEVLAGWDRTTTENLVIADRSEEAS
ncbi:MAG: folylpolyglutamate synthase/dihydrofolate synthase family protein [Anaerolineales bacterium]